MKKIYVITLATTEEKAINKYYHTLFKMGDRVDTLDFIDFKYPKLKVADTEENIEFLANHLRENGFDVKVVEGIGWRIA